MKIIQDKQSCPSCTKRFAVVQLCPKTSFIQKRKKKVSHMIGSSINDVTFRGRERSGTAHHCGVECMVGIKVVKSFHLWTLQLVGTFLHARAHTFRV